MPETDRQTIMPDRPLAPLLTMTQEEYDGLRELAQRYEEAGVSIAEIDAQRAARATAEEQIQALKIACDNLRWVADAEAKARETAPTASVEGQRMRAAIRALYDAGFWRCADVAPDVALSLWMEARDAAGIPAGTETARALRDTTAPRRGEPR